MTITPYGLPFGAASIAARRAGESFVGMRRELDDLQRQLATGLKSESYAGLGFERRTSLDLRGKLAAIAGYRGAIEGAELRVTAMTQGIEHLAKAARDTKSEILPPRFDPTDGRTSAQKSAEGRLKLAVDILNTEIDGRHLFSGRSHEVAPVASVEHLLDGHLGRAGLRQIIAERKAADLGAEGLGRLALTAPAPAQVRLSEDADAGVRQNFGFRLLAVEGSGAIAATPLAGSAPTQTLAFAAQPEAGDAVRVYVNDPDGRQRIVDLTARTAPSPGTAGTEFQVGATAAESGANLQAALALPPGATIADVQSKTLSPPDTPALGLTLNGGAAAAATLTVTAQPAEGATVSVTLGLRDGGERRIVLRARTGADPASTTDFAIGASPAATAANLAGALRRSLQAEAATGLAAASATLSSEDFFSASRSPGRWPRRIEGAGAPPSFALATTMRAGTSADTVLWYRGDDAAPSARMSAPLRVDATQTVAAGAQANEPALRNVVANLAVLAAERFGSSATDRQRYESLAGSAGLALGEGGAQQTLETMATELGSAMSVMNGASERHQATDALLRDAVADVEQASTEQVAASILALQTRLQASYQTTSILARLSIVNYL